MSDPRLEALDRPTESPTASSVKLNKIEIAHYRFFHEPITLELSGKNLLVYGENGTGKSSLYRALGLLAGVGAGNVADARNVFAEDDPTITFDFSDGRSLAIDRDFTTVGEEYSYLRPLSTFLPFLDYKRLLRVHLQREGQKGINLYALLMELFAEFPIGSQDLREIEDFVDSFVALKGLVNDQLLPDINALLRVFDPAFQISAFRFTTPFSEDRQTPVPTINLEVEFHEQTILGFEDFLNEARLSSLAISIYLASIRRLLGSLTGPVLKLLVLDDILISLDMANRTKLLAILKDSFADFQVVFLTHDKSLFELYRDQMDWAKYEFYLDDVGPIPRALVKVGRSELERAQVAFSVGDYDTCAWLLRKGLEKSLKSFLPRRDQVDREFNPLKLVHLLQKAIAATDGDLQLLLNQLNQDRDHILNPLAHSDSRPVPSIEVRRAMDDLGRLIALFGATHA